MSITLRKYKEVFTDSNGLIQQIKKTNATKYNDLFGDNYDDVLLDEFILFSNGNYLLNIPTNELYENNTDDFFTKISNIILLKYFDIWKMYLNNIANGVIDKAKNEVETTERTKTNSYVMNNSNTNDNKIFAYDSDTASNSTLNDNITTTDNNGNEHETTTYNKSGYDFGLSLFDLLEKYKNFQIENSFIELVKHDIINELCITIY